MHLPLCYYPTTAWFIDDSVEFLNEIRGRLLNKVPLFHLSSEPVKALDLINKPLEYHSFKTKNVISQEGSQMGSRAFQVNIETLRHYVYDKNRFKEISTVIVDYEMPDMNGLDFCDALKNPQIKKILLTGIADESKAIEAFNEGRIDGYIRKQDPHSLDQLEKMIHKLQFNYFIRQSDIYCEKFDEVAEATFPLLDPLFASHCLNVFKGHDICEFYLCTITGTYFLMNKEGKDWGFWSFVEDDFDFWEDFLATKDFNPQYTEMIQKRQKVALIDSLVMNHISSDTAFEKVLAPYEILLGKERYYTALKEKSLAIDHRMIYPLDAFIADHTMNEVKDF